MVVGKVPQSNAALTNAEQEVGRSVDNKYYLPLWEHHQQDAASIGKPYSHKSRASSPIKKTETDIPGETFKAQAVAPGPSTKLQNTPFQ